MRLALEDEGYEVDEAGSGEVALEHFAEQPSDVVLIDLMLPGMDGFECCRQLRRTSAVPVIMVTARTDTHDVVAGLEAGADDYVTKPFVAKELAARIRALLRRARSVDEPSVLTFGEVEVRPDEGTVRARRRRGPLHQDRVPTALRAGHQPGQGPQSRAAPRPRLGIRLLRRRSPGRRPHPTVADEDRTGSRQSPSHPDCAGNGLQADGLSLCDARSSPARGVRRPSAARASRRSHGPSRASGPGSACGPG